jgi:hypothetical protein
MGYRPKHVESGGDEFHAPTKLVWYRRFSLIAYNLGKCTCMVANRQIYVSYAGVSTTNGFIAHSRIPGCMKIDRSAYFQSALDLISEAL